MPIYSITDKETAETVLVDAPNQAQAVRVYMGDRLIATAALDASQAVALMAGGTRLIRAAAEAVEGEELPFSEAPEVKAFTAGMEHCDQAEAGNA